MIKNAKFKVAKFISLRTFPKAKYVLTSNTKQVLTQLNQMFSKIPMVFYYSNLKCYINIKIDIFEYIIGEILRHLVLSKYFPK